MAPQPPELKAPASVGVGTSDTAPAKGAALRALVAKKRAAASRCLEERRVADEASTERWSGLRIANRCIRQEKWDASMRGKELVPFTRLNTLSPAGRNHVVIGVLCARPAGPQWTPNGTERFAEWRLTDLNKEGPCQATLVLRQVALEYWATPEGAGHKSATVGSIFAILNAEAIGRTGTFRVSVETQVLKLGDCPSLGLCSAKTSNGPECHMPFNTEVAGGNGGLCSRHAGMSVWTRSREMAGPVAKRARVASVRSSGAGA